MATDSFDNRFSRLVVASKKFTQAMGLHSNLTREIYEAKTDWEFIIKIDALLEAAVKMVVRRRLNAGADEDLKHTMDDFVDALPMNGRVSLLAVLKADNCPKEITSTIESIRRLRNGFAHDIRLTDSRLIEIIKARPDKSQLIEGLCQIEKYDEADLIRQYEESPTFLRYCIIDATLRFLIIAYNISNPDDFQYV
jgi:hypothetical protein